MSTPWGGNTEIPTESQPSEGGYAEGYTFNSVTLALAPRHYPPAIPRLFLTGEMGLGSGLTKNREHDEVGAQTHSHQFGIGPSGAVGIGYFLRPLRDGTASLDIELLYQYLHTCLEIEGVGDYRWRAGMLQLVVGTTF